MRPKNTTACRHYNVVGVANQHEIHIECMWYAIRRMKPKWKIGLYVSTPSMPEIILHAKLCEKLRAKGNFTIIRDREGLIFSCDYMPADEYEILKNMIKQSGMGLTITQEPDNIDQLALYYRNYSYGGQVPEFAPTTIMSNERGKASQGSVLVEYHGERRLKSSVTNN